MATCAFCKSYLSTKEPQKLYKGKKYHLSCVDKMVEDMVSGDSERQKLEELICKIYNIDKITELISRQIDEFISQRGYTYSGMTACLYYFYVLEGREVDGKAKGIGIIPFIYNEVKNFYKDKKDSTSHNNSFIRKDEEIKIQIKPPDRKLPKVDINSL